jgi:hypothetical protein
VAAFKLTVRAPSEVWQNVLIWGTTPEVEMATFNGLKCNPCLFVIISADVIILLILEGLPYP